MTWENLPHAERARLRRLAARALTADEYHAWLLAQNGAGYRRVAAMLGIHPATARDRIKRARRKIQQAHSEENAA